jgi:hypothetical protein
MGNGDNVLVTQSQIDPFLALEAQLVRAVADFGVDELAQMLDAAEAIRRTRRL